MRISVHFVRHQRSRTLLSNDQRDLVVLQFPVQLRLRLQSIHFADSYRRRRWMQAAVAVAHQLTTGKSDLAGGGDRQKIMPDSQ